MPNAALSSSPAKAGAQSVTTRRWLVPLWTPAFAGEQLWFHVSLRPRAARSVLSGWP